MRTLGKIQEKNIKKKKFTKKIRKKLETNFGKNRKIWKKLGKKKVVHTKFFDPTSSFLLSFNVEIS